MGLTAEDLLSSLVGSKFVDGFVVIRFDMV